MDAIYIPHLTKLKEQTEVIQVQDFLPGLTTLTPIRGKLRIQLRGNFLEVSVKAETIITLTCHRCLQQYNHRLVVDTSEIIWLDETATKLDDAPLEREVALEDLVESLPPLGYFHPSEWLYEQLCLEIPQRQLCDAECAGIQSNDAGNVIEPKIDRRWASLEMLKKQLP